MKPTGGTPKALSLIEKLTATGNLIDIYDRERIKALKTPTIVTLDLMNDFDEKYGTDYHHHLLALFIDDAVSGEELIDVYPEFQETFNLDNYQPVLIFFNLDIQKICVITRRRKGNVAAELLPKSIDSKNLISSNQVHFVDESLKYRLGDFFKLDFADTVLSLSIAFEKIANADYNLVYRDLDSQLIEEMLAKGPNKFGRYINKSWSDNEDDDDDDDEDDGFSLEELEEANSEIKELDENLSLGIETIGNFFHMRQISYDNFATDD